MTACIQSVSNWVRSRYKKRTDPKLDFTEPRCKGLDGDLQLATTDAMALASIGSLAVVSMKCKRDEEDHID